MTTFALLRRSVLLFGLVATVAACESLPPDLKRADAAAKAGDYVTAVESWNLLSDYGYAEAKMKLAQAFIKGTGVKKNPAAAVPLLEEAVASGNLGAHVELGQLYEKGLGVGKNTAKAEELYLKAASAKFPRAMMALGRLYERQKQPAKALTYYRGAADMGIEAASEKLTKLQ